MSFKAFISYSTMDLNRAKQVRNLLKSTGSEVFLAEYSIELGTDLSNEIIEGIKQCDLFVLLWSSHAKHSDWVPQEIGIAKAEDKPVIPIILHKNIPLPGFIKGLKYLPLYKNPEQSLEWLQKNVFSRVQAKKQKDGLVWLGVGAVVLWLLGQSRDK